MTSTLDHQSELSVLAMTSGTPRQPIDSNIIQTRLMFLNLSSQYQYVIKRQMAAVGHHHTGQR